MVMDLAALKVRGPSDLETLTLPDGRNVTGPAGEIAIFKTLLWGLASLHERLDRIEAAVIASPPTKGKEGPLK